MFQFARFWTADEKTESSGLISSKHYQNSITSYFSESNFDLLLSFPNILTVTHFQVMSLLFLCHNFDLHSGAETATCA
jgi:hypothetical protein